MEKLKIPSDAQLMLIAVNDLNNSSLPLEHHLRALEELLVLVEHIDNAIGMYSSQYFFYYSLTDVCFCLFWFWFYNF